MTHKTSDKPLIIASVLLLSVASAHSAIIAHYDFDSDFTDSSGNGNHGTLTDVGTTGNTAITSSTSAFGGGSIDFSDDRDFLTITNPNFQNGDAYTVAFWAKRDSATRTFDIVAGNTGDADNFLTFVDGATIRYEGDAGDSSRIDFAHGVTSTNWNHYAYVSDGANIAIYVNGASVVSQAENTSLDIPNIGAGYTSGLESDFQGQVDEFFIFDTELSASAISLLHTTNVPEPSSAALILGLAGVALILRRRK